MSNKQDNCTVCKGTGQLKTYRGGFHNYVRVGDVKGDESQMCTYCKCRTTNGNCEGTCPKNPERIILVKCGVCKGSGKKYNQNKNYREKYIKYKNKYLELKKSLLHN